MARYRPDSYASAMQEDHFVEWLTVFAFASAAVLCFVRAVRARRWFDILVAMFLLFVAGEEISWGQRLLGLTPPEYFLAHNTQQEMNVHNFANLFGSPKGPFTLVLLGYAVVLPVLAVFPPGRRFLGRIGATPPPRTAIVWFLACIVLFTWYPVRFTGEWTELLAGSTFLVSMGVASLPLLALLSLSSVCSVALTWWSARGDADPVRVACARAELTAVAGLVRTELSESRSTHKRLWTLAEERRVNADAVHAALAQARCADPSGAERRRYMVDPWGTAYWVRVIRRGEERELLIYSFGPNRRRDLTNDRRESGDDIVLSP